MAQSYSISEATICRTIRKVEDALIRSKKFHLPGKKALQTSDMVFKVVLVDVSEQPVERPKKIKNGTIAAKKRRHTQKAQVIADRKSAQIVTTAFSYGIKHDSQLFKDDACEFSEHLHILADAGYQGLMELHENS